MSKHYLKWLSVLVLILFALASAMAQKPNVVYEGKTMVLSVEKMPNTVYSWRIFRDRELRVDVSEDEIQFLQGKEGSDVPIICRKQGTYYLKVSALVASGCMNLKVGMIRVVPNPVQSVIAGSTVTGACQQVKLDGSKSIGDIVSYAWSVLDKGAILTRPSGVVTDFVLGQNFTGKLPALFRVRLEVTNKAGDKHADTLAIKVNEFPVAEIQSGGKIDKDGSMEVDATISIGENLTYRWSTREGKIIGPTDKSSAKLCGAGVYTLDVIDQHGCRSTKSFTFPLETHEIIARPDYARTSWSKDTTIQVLRNDYSTADLIKETLRISVYPEKGSVKVNSDGTITYIPRERKPGRDQFEYEICDAVNVCASATVAIDIYDKGISVPEAFSPNGDGVNETLVFPGLVENYPNSSLYVYTRAGQLIYSSTNYQNDWGGTTQQSSVSKTVKVPTGTYYYILTLGGTSKSVKGFVYVAY